MYIKQISIFIENKEGRLAEVTNALAKANVDIRALSIADTSDFGILRIIVDDYKKAEEVLKKENFTVGKTNVIAVQVEDKSGGLNKILQSIKDDDINVEYMYATFIKDKTSAIMIFRFDNLKEAKEKLIKNKFKILSAV